MFLPDGTKLMPIKVQANSRYCKLLLGSLLLVPEISRGRHLMGGSADSINSICLIMFGSNDNVSRPEKIPKILEGDSTHKFESVARQEVLFGTNSLLDEFVKALKMFVCGH